MLDKSIANSVAKLDGLKARFALSRATTFDQSGQDLTGTPQLQVVEPYPAVEESDLAQRKNLRMGAEDHAEQGRTAMPTPDHENEPA
jgi:hypothetical protein